MVVGSSFIWNIRSGFNGGQGNIKKKLRDDKVPITVIQQDIVDRYSLLLVMKHTIVQFDKKKRKAKFFLGKYPKTETDEDRQDSDGIMDATFSNIRGILQLSNGSIILSDADRNCCIRKITSRSSNRDVEPFMGKCGKCSSRPWTGNGKTFGRQIGELVPHPRRSNFFFVRSDSKVAIVNMKQRTLKSIWKNASGYLLFRQTLDFILSGYTKIYVQCEKQTCTEVSRHSLFNASVNRGQDGPNFSQQNFNEIGFGNSQPKMLHWMSEANMLAISISSDEKYPRLVDLRQNTSELMNLNKVSAHLELDAIHIDTTGYMYYAASDPASNEDPALYRTNLRYRGVGKNK